MTSAPVRIGNCSGFYGDRHSAMREMLTGGDLDYLTGDYLAELTMLILARDRAKSADRGYAKTFLTQLEECLGTALDQGVRIVANAGGLNPAGLATAVRALAERLGLRPRSPMSRATTSWRAQASSVSGPRWPPTPTSARGASSTASTAAPTSSSPAG